MKAIGVDLGGTNLRAALVDTEAGKILAEQHHAIADARDPDAVISQIATAVSTLEGATMHPVGVGIAAMLRGATGVVVNAPNLGWREVDFGARLERMIGRRVGVYNDLNAIAAGEQRFGAARGASDVLCVFVGTGVGAGVIANGQLVAGAAHLAGEIGHVKVVPGGKRCGCGERGCLEAYASGHALLGRTEDPAAIEEASTHLGRALAFAVTILNPSRLVMGGGLWNGVAALRDRTRDILLTSLHPPAREGFAIVDSTLADHAGVLGAAALAPIA